MSSAGVVEPVDVLEDRRLGLTSSMPFLAPDHLGFQAFEERLNRRIVVAVSFAAHRRTQAIGLQLLLIVIGAILQASLRSLHRFDCCHGPSGTGNHVVDCAGARPYPAP